MENQRDGKSSRRQFIKTSSAATAFMLAPDLPLKATTEAEAERVQQRQPGKQFIADSQTHIFWRREGHVNTSERGWWFLNQLDTFYKGVAGPNGSVKDLTKARFLDLVLRQSETSVALLNCLALKDFYGGKHMLTPEEAVEVRSMLPDRVVVLGSVDPADGKAALEDLERQVKDFKITGIKLYPGDYDNHGWHADDEKIAYPLWEKCRQLGVRYIAIHKGLPFSIFNAKYCHPEDVDQALDDFPDLNFVLYHSAYPYLDELTMMAFRLTGRKSNLYVDLGGLFAIMMKAPYELGHTMGKLLKYLGPDHIIWGTDSPITGSPQPYIDFFRSYQIPEELCERYGYPQITAEDKRKIMGENLARLLGINIEERMKRVANDIISRSREEGV
ncbi:MAG TPA: amidohydrolase family protein [Pyrinomonadaceae bacterium]|nr:amidohydrolase family protein [Pyrinomonadaceae bacterium]